MALAVLKDAIGGLFDKDSTAGGLEAILRGALRK
jgi:hypothetical protein